MTTHRILVSGFGGQGVMGIGQLLTYAGMFEGKEVSWLPSYGPEMRGGAANCSVILSDEPVGAPNISKAQNVIVMNEPSLDKFESYVEEGGNLFINSTLVSRDTTRTDINSFMLPVNKLTEEYGNARALNMIMVGAFNEVAKVVSDESVAAAVKELYGKKRPELLEMNLNAVKFGAEKIKEIINGK